MSGVIYNLPDATFAIDREGKVIAWNRAIEELTGVKAMEILGKGNYEYALPFYQDRRPMLIDLVAADDRKIEGLGLYRYPEDAEFPVCRDLRHDPPGPEHDHSRGCSADLRRVREHRRSDRDSRGYHGTEEGGVRSAGHRLAVPRHPGQYRGGNCDHRGGLNDQLHQPGVRKDPRVHQGGDRGEAEVDGIRLSRRHRADAGIPYPAPDRPPQGAGKIRVPVYPVGRGGAERSGCHHPDPRDRPVRYLPPRHHRQNAGRDRLPAGQPETELLQFHHPPRDPQPADVPERRIWNSPLPGRPMPKPG